MPVSVIPFPAIDPVFFSIGPIAIQPAATTLHIDDLLMWVTLGVILGGRLGYVLFYNPGFYLAHPAEIPALWRGGMSFHGGFLGVIAAIWLYARRHDLNPLSLLDLAAAGVTIGLFFGRIANFINAELYGRATDVPWAMVFPGAGPDPRHPSQLYEAALEGVLLFIILRFATHRRGTLKRPGLTAGLFAAGYGLARAFVELFRMPDAHIGFLAGGLTMGMILSVPMLLIGVALIWNARRSDAARDG
jgi:phosphatidylglycerol:prolipoprotein diacylglycerol transferase